MSLLRAYVLAPSTPDLDVFYTLPTALGAEWHFEYARLERERFTLELLPDVHPAHGIGNAIVVVAEANRAYLRLALANAWRAGVRRFILLFAGRVEPTPADRDHLEQELRVWLDTLGDGGAAPAVYAALTRCAGSTAAMRPGMVRLLAEIERVFSDEPVIASPLPAAFAREAAILDAIAPLVRGATMLAYRACELEDTLALGSHVHGWPYLPLDEPWPRCPRCKREVACYQQFDLRDALHAAPAAHRLFVIYRCEGCYADGVVVRHYDDPSPNARRPIDPAAPMRGEPQRVIMDRAAYMLPDRDLLEQFFPEVVAQLRAIQPAWERLYWHVEHALGMGSLRIPDHLGGWHTAQTPSIPACACDTPLRLVSSTQWGDWWNTIWACPIHADLTTNLFHK